MKSISGTYLHLQRLSTEDGPGIRTTVFLKGCLLCCKWCHNPESLLSTPQIQRIETNCIQCGTCIQVCPQECIQLGADFVEINRDLCDHCGICVDECPAGALEILGTQISADDLFGELIKDRSYYEKSGGGVTFSGGEPALQADFCAAVMKRLQESGIQTALDTCGMTSQSNLEKILPYADLVLYDLKEIDPEKHRVYTGQTNEVILNNLSGISEYIRQHAPDTRVWVRTPMIPGATDTRENLTGIGRLLEKRFGDIIERWELCAFNNLCRDKYSRLGMPWDYMTSPLLTREILSQLENWAKESGFPPERILATGATQVPV